MSLAEAKQLKWIHDLYQFGQSGALQNGSNQIFDLILRHVVEGLSADSGSLALYQGDNANRLCLVAGIGLPEASIGSVIPDGSGVIGWVLANRQALLLKGDINDDPRFHGYIPKSDTKIPVSALCWPLLVNQQLLGAICVNKFDERHSYTEEALERGQLLVNLIALVLENIKLHIDQRMRIQQLADTNARNAETNRQLQEAQTNLAQSEQRLNEILNSLDSVVWAMEPDSLKLLYLNKAAFDISGRTVEAFFSDPALWLNIIEPIDRRKVENGMAALENNPVQKLTYRIRRPDGELRWLFHHMRLVRDQAGKPFRIDGITVDITQHKKAEDMLKQRNAELQIALDKIQEVQRQLVQSEKLSSIGQLAAGVAHEINNPIGYVNSNLSTLSRYVEELLTLIGHYEILEGQCADAEQIGRIQAFKNEIDLEFTKSDVVDLLNESQEGAARVKKIVQDLKDFSHSGGDDDWQWADLHACLESTLNIVHNEIKYKASVIKEFGVIPNVWCLPHQLNQVFMNLLVNAAHAIENEGKIIVRTGADQDHVWVEVSDTGKGIAPEHVNKIFDPFFTTKPVGQGTGLGLSVSYNIIKKHNGEIRLESRVGEGSTFRVLLLKKGEAAQA